MTHFCRMLEDNTGWAPRVVVKMQPGTWHFSHRISDWKSGSFRAPCPPSPLNKYTLIDATHLRSKLEDVFAMCQQNPPTVSNPLVFPQADRTVA
jgi:hypothetical protein